MMINVPDRNNPINAVFDRIELRCPFRPLDIFEPFGGDGMSQIIDYALRPRVNSLTAWDIDINRAAQLKIHFPDTDVNVCNAFEEVARLHHDFDVIIIDNNVLQAPHFEHFDLFPAIFNGLKKDSAFIVISACGDPGDYYAQRELLVRNVFGSRWQEFVKDWDAARRKFYKLLDASDLLYESRLIGHTLPVTGMSVNDMVPIYMDLALKAGFFTKYQTVVPRSKWLKYILLELQHTKPKAEREANLKDKLDRKNAADLYQSAK